MWYIYYVMNDNTDTLLNTAIYILCAFFMLLVGVVAYESYNEPEPTTIIIKAKEISIDTQKIKDTTSLLYVLETDNYKYY